MNQNHLIHMGMKTSLILSVFVTAILIVTACKKESNPLSSKSEAPEVPTGLTAIPGEEEILLSWKANSEENLSHYNIYQGTASGSLDKVEEVPAGMETYTAGELSSETTYYFSINAENDDGMTSDMTPEVSATAEAAAPARYESAWTQQFGSSAEDGFGIFGLAYDDDGILWAVGHFGASFEGVGGPFVMRIDSENGTRLSVEALDFPVVPIRPNAIALMSDGGYVVAGTIFGALPGETKTGNNDAFVARFDDTGAYQWGKQVGVEGEWTEAYAVEVSPSGNIYLAGNVSEGGALPGQTASGGGRDVFLMKYDSDGNQEWIRQFGNGSDRMWGHGIATDGDEIIVMGTVSDDASPLPGSTDGGNGFIRRYDESGDDLETVQVDVPIGDNEGAGMTMDSSGSFWVFGSGSDPFGYGNEGGRDFVMAKIDPVTGEVIAAGQLGSSQSDWGDSIALGTDDEVYVGGATNGSLPGHSNAGDYDIAIARLQSIE